MSVASLTTLAAVRSARAPLVPYLDSETARTIVPLAIGFGGVMANLVIAKALQSSAS